MRLVVRAVKGVQFTFIGAKRETLDRRCGDPGAGFQQAGQNNTLLFLEVLFSVTLGRDYTALGFPGR
jgi:hypothetical protein